MNIYDVSKHAGVSIATVSRVLNGNPNVSERTRDKACFLDELEKVKEKGYALDARELEEHMECVGAPVFGPDGTVMGAISVSSAS